VARLPALWKSTCLSLAAVLLLSLPGRADLAAAEDVAALRDQALELERSQRWLAAAEVYAELAALEPGQLEWGKALRRCWYQDRLTRRILDRTYQQKLLRLDLDRALQIYRDALLQIETHYIDAVDLNRLLIEGAENLDFALDNTAFRKALFPRGVREELAAGARSTIREYLPTLSASFREEAVRKVRSLANALKQDWGALPAAVVMEFVAATCDALDPYSVYLGPNHYSLEQALALHDVAGVGMDLTPTDQGLFIAQVVPESAAARAGVFPNDIVFKIDGLSVRNMSREEANLRLLGREGTTVTLEVQSATDLLPRRVDIVRQLVNVPSITEARMVDESAGIGYIHIGLFQKTTLRELDIALANLSGQGMRALILDLRGNPGGLFKAAVDVADRFIPEGTIVSTVGRNPTFSTVFPAHAEGDMSLPLVVLVDQQTASAAEIVAGALQDHAKKKTIRAVLVGQRTYGKGSIQYVFPLIKGEAGGIRLTAARFYSPLGLPYHEQGITPDVLVEVVGETMPMSMMGEMRELQVFQFDVAVREIRQLLSKP